MMNLFAMTAAMSVMGESDEAICHADDAQCPGSCTTWPPGRISRPGTLQLDAYEDVWRLSKKQASNGILMDLINPLSDVNHTVTFSFHETTVISTLHCR
jgi:hypothetical protein